MTVVSPKNFNQKTSVLNFVDIIGENATVELAADATVNMLKVNGVVLKRGQYSAENLPTRFSGTGVLTVRTDDRPPRGLILRVK